MGGIIGIVFYLLQQVTGHLAGLFNLIPSVTILTPVLVLLSLAVLAQYWHGFRKPAAVVSSAVEGARIKIRSQGQDDGQ